MKRLGERELRRLVVVMWLKALAALGIGMLLLMLVLYMLSEGG